MSSSLALTCLFVSGGSALCFLIASATMLFLERAGKWGPDRAAARAEAFTGMRLAFSETGLVAVSGFALAVPWIVVAPSPIPELRTGAMQALGYALFLGLYPAAVLFSVWRLCRWVMALARTTLRYRI